MSKKLLSLFLTICLCIGLTANLPVYANDKDTTRTGTFHYAWQVGHDSDAVYYYEDDYFRDSSYVYNPHLATMSMCLEMAAFASEGEPDYSKKMKNAEQLFNEIGFSGFDQNYTDFREDGIVGKPTRESLGVVAANKKVIYDGKKYTLIAAAVRGSGYEREWAGNFKIGENGQHQGFSQAKEQLMAFLEKYIKEKEIQGNIKLWLTGFSRGGATVNLVAGAIDGHQYALSGCNLELKDLFAYGFETPAAETASTDINGAEYQNIFNLINPSDPVPKAAPACWKFKRYGVDHYLPSAETDGTSVYQVKLQEMLSQYQQLEGYSSYDVDNFTMKKVGVNLKNISNGKTVVGIVDDDKNVKSQNAFLNEYITLIAKQYVKERSTYVDKYQDGICDACAVYFGTDYEKRDQLLPIIKQKLSDNWASILWELIRPFGGKKAAYDKIARYVRESLDQAGMTNYTEATFEKSVSELCDLAVKVVLGQPNLATTLVENVTGITQAHDPEVCLAWLRSLDSNYVPSRTFYGIAADTAVSQSFSNGKYRIVRIHGLVDVHVYDANQELVTTIINETPQFDGEVTAVINDDEEKLIYLPVNMDYTVRVTGFGDGTFDYAVQEYNPKAGEVNRLVNFNDIKVESKKEWIGVVPAYSVEDMEDISGKASTTNYSLLSDQISIPASYEKNSEEAIQAYYNVDAVPDEMTKGLVFGSGMRQIGTYVKVTAMPFEGYQFAGWYADGTTLVSSNAEYRFRVDNDVKVVARFQKEEKTESTKKNGATDGTLSSGKDRADRNDNSDRNVVASSDCEIKYIVNSDWGEAFNAQIEVTNKSTNNMKNWTLELDSNNEITELWNGEILSHVGKQYVIGNKDYNAVIEPGQTVVVGLKGKSVKGSSCSEIENVVVKANQ